MVSVRVRKGDPSREPMSALLRRRQEASCRVAQTQLMEGAVPCAGGLDASAGCHERHRRGAAHPWPGKGQERRKRRRRCRAMQRRLAQL